MPSNTDPALSDSEFTCELEEICYWLYESSGNSKYVRAGRPQLHPDEAVKKLAQLFREQSALLVREARAEAYDDCSHWLNDTLTSKKDVAEICGTRAKVLRGEIEEPKSRFSHSKEGKKES